MKAGRELDALIAEKVMGLTRHDEYPFADHQECLEAAARHNETFDRVRRENPTYRLHYFASCVKDGRKQEAS